jgi:hypothetical protein
MDCFQFRYVRFLIAAILLTAAGLKAFQLATTPILGEGLLHARWFNVLVVDFELLFALWLCFGQLPKLTRLVSILLFSIFAAVSFYKAISGETSCGCFGNVSINPWYTMTFDLVIVGLLTFCREPFSNGFQLSGTDRKKLIAALFAGCVITLPILGAVLSLQYRFHATLGQEFTAFTGRKGITLEPTRWQGKEFPLADRFAVKSDDEFWKQGEWQVVLVHADCKKCQTLLAGWKEQNMKNVLLVEIPSEPKKMMPDMPFPVYKLDNKNGWFADTPTIIRLKNGICTEIHEP